MVTPKKRIEMMRFFYICKYNDEYANPKAFLFLILNIVPVL